MIPGLGPRFDWLTAEANELHARDRSFLYRAVVERGWVPADRLVHYKLHAEIDERHAEEFFAVLEPSWDDGSRRYYIEQGLELGAYIFDRLYRDMYAVGREETAAAGGGS